MASTVAARSNPSCSSSTSTRSKRDATEIGQGGDKASRDLWRARAGHPDLVESQMNVVLPAHRLHDQSDLAVLVARPSENGRRASCLRMSCNRSIACRAVVGSWKGDSDNDAPRCRPKPYPVGNVLVESRLELQAQRREEAVLVQVVGIAVDDEQRSARGNERAKGRDSSSTQSARTASATSARVPIIVDARLFGCDDTWSLRIDGRRPTGVRIPAVDELPRVVTDELDQR